MAVFTDILPPPQSLENLDNWGDLDSLLWSLDSTIWETAGIYGIVSSETADGSSSFSYHLTRCLVLSGNAQTSGKMTGVVVAEISGDGYSKTDGKLSVDRVQNVSCLVNADSSSAIVFERIRSCEALAGVSTSGGIAGYVLVRTLSGSLPSLSGNALSFLRIRTETSVSASISSQVERGIRIRQSVVSGASSTAENSILPAVVRTLSALALARASASDIFLRISPLMVSEPAVSGDSSVVSRVRTSGAHNAFSSSGVQSSFIRARSVNATLSSASKELFAFLRVRDISSSAFANTLEAMEGSRFYGMVAVEGAESSEACNYVRILQNVLFVYSVSNNTFLGGRLLGLNCPSLSVTFGVATLSRLVELEAYGQGLSFSEIYPEYKGWGWKEQKIEGGQWANKSTGTSEWSNLNYSDNAEWNALESGQNDWNQIPGGSSRWRGVVEWQ